MKQYLRNKRGEMYLWACIIVIILSMILSVVLYYSLATTLAQAQRKGAIQALDEYTQHNAIDIFESIKQHNDKTDTLDSELYISTLCTAQSLEVDGDTLVAKSADGSRRYVVSDVTVSYTVENTTKIHVSYVLTLPLNLLGRAVWVDIPITISTRLNPKFDNIEIGTLNVTATSYIGTYDGASHGITVTCDQTDATITYGTTANDISLSEKPAFTNAGTYAVYYQVTKHGYNTVIGSETVKITRASVTLPVQSNTLYYSGSTQSPTWDANYDTSKMTLGGVTSGTEAGTYIATFTPGDNYQWSDGTIAAKDAPWTIEVLQYVYLTLDPGLYTADGDLIADWDTLVNDFGMEASVAYSSSDYATTETSPYCVLSNNEELANGSILVMGDDISSIGMYAFYGCSNLTDIVISSNVTSLGAYSFANCTNLESAYIPGSISSVSGYVFQDCISLETVLLNEGTTTVGAFAFSGCTGLKDIDLPESVTMIGAYAFQGCGFGTFEFPDTVTSLQTGAFSNCASLESITVPGNISTIYEATFQSCAALKTVILQEGVTAIKSSAFAGCTSLESIELPTSVTALDGTGIFSGCTALATVTVPDTLTKIGQSVFYICTSLKSFDFTNITSIGQAAFYGSGLESIVLPGTLSMSYGSFNGCAELTSITFCDGITAIAPSAFMGCTSLESVTIISSITAVHTNAFSGCTALKSVVFENATGWVDASSQESIDVTDPAANAEALIAGNSVPWTRTSE